MKPTIEKALAAGIALAVAGGLAVIAMAAAPGTPRGAVSAPLEAVRVLPAPLGAAAYKDDRTHASVVFAGGCFWGVQGVFQHVKGVSNAVSGYIGGSPGDARYDRVSRGATGHAEAVRVDYDPRQVSYGQLLQVFFSVAHDPTQLNRQGPDVGSQYRSAIFTPDARQQAANQAYVRQIQPALQAPVATRLEDGQRFHPAEDYHQNYMARFPQAPYIRYYDAPKLAALRQQFPALYRSEPHLVPMK